MIPVGYVAKHIVERPAWLKAAGVIDIYSVSGCISPDWADFINYWKHNGYWFFDSPEAIRSLANEHSIDVTGTRLFYYEAREQEFDEYGRVWRPFFPEPSFITKVVPPAERYLEGYDVVSFYARTSPECSPLSCNSLASELETNQHCLLSSEGEALKLLEGGVFQRSEPGPYRVFSVSSVQVPIWPEGC